MFLQTGLKLVANRSVLFRSGWGIIAVGSRVPSAGSKICSFGPPHGKTEGESAKSNQAEFPKNKTEPNRLEKAKDNCDSLVRMKMNESGTPGLILGVAVDGKVVFKSGYGYADVEKDVLATPDTIMRIASISKCLTMAAVAKLMEAGKIDLDMPVREYVPSWPQSHPTITTRQIVSHCSGIRGYFEDELHNTKTSMEGPNGYVCGDVTELHNIKKFDSVEKALEIFKNDDLVSMPGTKHHYSTHGYTLLSAVVEKAAGENFERHMRRMFKDLGLQNTYLDENIPLIPNRASQYVRDEKHVLRNAPYVDNSCKWGAGGFVSTVGDLLKFANAMLYSYQSKQTESEKLEVFWNEQSLRSEEAVYKALPFSPVNLSSGNPNQSKNKPKGFLTKETMEQIWRPVVRMEPMSSLNDDFYAMGWMAKPEIHDVAFGRRQELSFYHTGGAVGGRGVLLICPQGNKLIKVDEYEEGSPRGIVVAILCNLENVSLARFAGQIASEFQGLQSEVTQKADDL